MSADYDIQIRLDPSQPVQGAAAVTSAVAKIEAQGKKAQSVFDSLATAIQREQAMLENIHGPAQRYAQDLQTLDALHAKNAITAKEHANQLKKLESQNAATGIAALNFKQAAAGVNQAFDLLNQKLKITDSEVGSVIGSAVKFGAMGAQIGGPWGAALGAIGGALVDLDDKINNPIKNLIEAKERQDAWNNSIAYGASQTHRLTSGFDALHKTLDGLAQSRMLAIFIPGQLAVAAYNDEIKRQDALYEKATGAQREYHANIDSLNAMLKAGKITSTQFNNAIEDLNGTHDAAAKAVEKHTDAYRALMRIMETVHNRTANPREPYAGYERDVQMRGLDAQQAADLGNSGRSLFGGGGLRVLTPTLNPTSSRTGDPMSAAIAQSYEQLKKISEMNELIAAQFKGMAAPLSDSLVDAFNGMDVSAAKVGETLLIGFEKAIAQALILKAITGSVSGSEKVGGSYGGLLGLIGFASGGVISPSGSGTTDSQTVMFRKSPSETVRINTPAQEAAYARGSGGGSPVTVQVVDQRDSRALAPSRSDHQVFVDLATRNAGFLRSLTRR